MPIRLVCCLALVVASCVSLPASELPWEDPGVEVRERLKRERLFDHFALGTTAPIEWFVETRRDQGARWHFRQQYLSGGAGWDGTRRSWDTVFLHEWNRWENPDRIKGMWLRNKHIGPSIENGFIPWLTFYNLAQSHPADYRPGPAQAAPANARNSETMRAYWEQVKLLMQICAEYAPHPIVVHVEPDEWGHLLLHGAGAQRMDPLAVDVKVGSAGMPELEGFEDNLRGYSHAFLKLRALYAPENVFLVANPSAWSQNGACSAANWIRVFDVCDVTGHWDALVIETGDRDIGCTPGKGLAPPYDRVDTTGSHFHDLDEQLRWIADIAEATELPFYFWQVGVGNFYFRTCNQTEGHFSDRIAQALLEGYPENPMIGRYVDIGVFGFVFSPGQAHQTHVYDYMKDGITNPEPIPGNLGHVSEFPDDDGGYMRLRAGAYYQNPYPILADRPLPEAGGSASGEETGESAEERAARRERERAERAERLAAMGPPEPTESALERFKAYVQARVIAAAGESRRGLPVELEVMQGRGVRIVDADEQLVTIRDGNSQVGMPFWDRFPLVDWLALADVTARSDQPEDQAAVAFFARALGRDELAARAAARAGDFAAEVAEAFPR